MFYKIKEIMTKPFPSLSFDIKFFLHVSMKINQTKGTVQNYTSVWKADNNCHTRDPSWILSQPAVNRTCNLFWCAVSHPSPIGPPPFRKLAPKFSSLPWTLWLCLGFWAKLRIWLVHDCKMKPSSTCILECGTPSWDCYAIFFNSIPNDSLTFTLS